MKGVAVVTEVLFKKNERVLTAFNVYLRNYLNNLTCATHQKRGRSWVQEAEEGRSELGSHYPEQVRYSGCRRVPSLRGPGHPSPCGQPPPTSVDEISAASRKWLLVLRR